MLNKIWQQIRPIITDTRLLKTTWIEPQKSRKMTQAEIDLAYSVFGARLDVRDIYLKTAWWVLKNYAVSPNGNIYFHPKDWVEDFTHESLSK